jgi:endonuclease/exonuclease/phosphatase (EEP) superfamily protein YafD
MDDPELTERSAVSRVAGLAEAAAWLAAACSAAGFFGASHWLAELCAHFRWQYAALGALALALGALARLPRLAALGLALALLNAMPVVRGLWTPWPAPIADGMPLRLVVANVYVDNPDLGRFLQWIESQDPDLVVVVELSEAHAQALRGLAARLPHVALHARGVFGVGLWSRYPLVRQEVQCFDDILCPALDTELALSNGPLRLTAMHAFPPLGARGSARNLEQLQALARFLGPPDGRGAIVAGDFNATPFAARYLDLLAATGLRSAADGRLPLPTWQPSGLVAILALPLDHVLARGATVSVRGYAIGPDIGSDHRPLRVDFVTAHVAR